MSFSSISARSAAWSASQAAFAISPTIWIMKGMAFRALLSLGLRSLALHLIARLFSLSATLHDAIWAHPRTRIAFCPLPNHCATTIRAKFVAGRGGRTTQRVLSDRPDRFSDKIG